MRRKLGVIVTLLIAILINSTCINVNAADTPHFPATVKYAPRILTSDNVVPEQSAIEAQQITPDLSTAKTQPAAPVLKRVTSADMKALDLRQPCGFSAAEIESVTKYNLCGLGKNFADQDSEINAIFLMSVAALESGWGRYKLNQYNLFGMIYYRPQSYDGCIDYAANAISTNYLAQGGAWYHGATVSSVNIDYCVNADGSVNTSWTDKVSEIMAEMYNQIYLAQYQKQM